MFPLETTNLVSPKAHRYHNLYILYHDLKDKPLSNGFFDDTALWTIPSTITHVQSKIMQLELNRFTDWTKYWKMSINPNKCSYISFHKPNKTITNRQYTIDDIAIKKVSECRYLGLWLNSSLSLQTHISKIKDKLQKHLYHIFYLQNTGVKLYPKTTLQIYKSKSRPCIEFASIFYFHKDTKKVIQSLQNKFIRAAYPCRKSTPIHTLEMIANIAPISIRVQQLILRNWFRAKYSSQFHPLHKTFLKHKPKKNSHKNQHPFDIAYKILNNNKTNITIHHKIQPINGPITSLPKYDIFEIPSNYTINTKPHKKQDIQPSEINFYTINNKPHKNHDKQPSDINFFTDGSCVPNPGKGAYGWYSPNYHSTPSQEIIPYRYPTTITNCEAMAVLSALCYIKNNLSPNPKINIYTDCQTVLQYLNFQAYPKYNNTRNIIQAILRTLCLIQNKNPNLRISINKVKAHTNIDGNNIIDKMVRESARKISYKTNQLKHTSYQVTLAQIHKYTTKTWKAGWKTKSNPNRCITTCHNKYNTKIHNLINTAKLNKHQCGVIIRIITEHIELNQYIFKYQMKCPNTNKIPESPYCIQCDKLETVHHFLLKCKRYSHQRYKLFQKLIKINYKFKYTKFKSTKFLLFPYLVYHTNITQQITIWKEILNYTKNTQRFKNLYQIDLKQI